MPKVIVRSSMNIKHPRLEQNERGEVIARTPSQNKSRNTESVYNFTTNELFMAGVKIASHPKFKDIVQLENYCNMYWVKEYELSHGKTEE